MDDAIDIGIQIMNDSIYDRVGRNHAILDDSMGEMVDVIDVIENNVRLSYSIIDCVAAR